MGLQKDSKSQFPLIWQLVALVFAALFLFPEVMYLKAGVTDRAECFSAIGKQDFFAYWGQFQIFAHGGNPYNADAVLRVQKTIEPLRSEPALAWNPPWLFTLMTPVLSFSFERAAALWMICNLLMLGAVAYFSWRIIDDEFFPAPAFMAAIMFFPAWECIEYGQVSLMVAFGIAGCIFALREKKDLLAAFFIIFVTIKPQLLYLPGIFLLWWVVVNKRYKFLLSSMILFAGLLLLTELQGSTPFTYLMQAEHSGLLDWQSSTFVTVVRDVLANFTHSYPVWPVVGVPLLISIYACGYLLSTRPEIDWSRHFAPLLCISVFTAPYAWFYDHAVLAIVQVMLVARLFRSRSSMIAQFEIYFWLVLFEILRLSMRIHVTNGKEFAWFPAILLLIWLRAGKLEKSPPRFARTLPPSPRLRGARKSLSTKSPSTGV